MGRSASLVVMALLAQSLGCASRSDGPEARARARQLFDRTVLAAKTAGSAGTSVLARLAVLEGKRFGLTDAERRQLLEAAWDTDAPSPEAAFASARLEGCERALARIGTGRAGALYIASGCEKAIVKELRDSLGRGEAGSFLDATEAFAFHTKERRTSLLKAVSAAVDRPKAVFAQARLARLLAESGDGEGALAMARRAVESLKTFFTFGEHQWLYETLGRVLLPAGDIERLLAALQDKELSARSRIALALLAAGVAPKTSDALVEQVQYTDPVGRAAVHLARGRRDVGEKLLREAFAARGDKEWERMGAVAATHGLHTRLGAALARRDAYVRSAWHGGAAEALLEAGRLEQAAAQVGFMVGSPARARVQLALAQAHGAKGDAVVARRWLREALRDAGPAEGGLIAATARAWGRWFLALVAVAVARRDPVIHAQGLMELVLLTEAQGPPVDPVERVWDAALR